MQKKNGISLIVLVITIIVMVVLAGAIVLTLNNSGIISKASGAVTETNLATVKEVASLAWAEAYTEGARTVDDLEQAVLSALTEAKVDTTQYIITVTENGVDVISTEDNSAQKDPVPEDWAANVVSIEDGVPIPKGFVASGVEGENKKATGLVIYEGSDAVTSENHTTALTTRNQFVWVPVDDMTKFQPYSDSTSYQEDGYDISIYWSEANNTAESQAMYSSVEKYGGFYVARYQMGSTTDTTEYSSTVLTDVGSKQGLYIYDTCTTNQAKTVARSLYTSDNANFGVVSTLMYGVQFRYLEKGWITIGDYKNITNLTKGSGEYSMENVSIYHSGPGVTEKRGSARTLFGAYNNGAWPWDDESSNYGNYAFRATLYIK